MIFPKMPRMTSAAIMVVLLLCLVAFISPQQLPVIVYKVSLVTIAGFAGYCFDRALFPYARPDKYDIDGILVEASESQEPESETTTVFDSSSDWIPFVAAQFRRAAIVCACMLAVGLGL
ncbi:MAG: hypothetical protein CL942_08640 [Desulfovibrio sp.]|nr:hypothetical protein [Desulfovibrio sp.]|tara:strand:+ start:7273 stop:7629 length:357 start_codon:yes stop_codon:yes gene_type:complete